MNSLGKSIVILTSCTVSSVLAFGPLLEPLSSSHSCTLQTRRHASQLQASNSEYDNSSRSHASGFDFVSAEFESLDDFSLLFERDLFHGTLPFLKEKADALAYEAFDENEIYDLDAWDHCGDDCKECEIPKDW
eukprot:CAMPEP_0116141920 /NCGR_PEP_ID=MMETSP0329-20121206/14633_1 /TAXON_ID=697910 /ORGANISM="Pseudo-nitzschia arenysensis, Strain B593" /LENGTH=132 /DNA_ID=CAMNT_0003637123 /DNA_START=120 /DNA_END=515 /DNA_ORIENTATION=+